MPAESLDAQIESFIGHFRNYRVKIASIGEDHDHRLFKKNLYVAVLDGLSRSVFPRKGNRDRFVSFVRTFGEWADSERVSLPHLVRLLAKSPDPAFSRVREFALEEIGKWAEGELVSLSRDPSFEQIKQLWPREQEHRTPLEGTSLESLQHIQLLYSFRNSLIHEFREPGYSLEDDEDQNPYYMSLSRVGSALEVRATSWELVYPVSFFEQLCDSCLAELEAYLKKDRLNPRESFVFGSYWLEILNR